MWVSTVKKIIFAFLCHKQWIKCADAHRTRGEAVAWDTCHSIANPLVLIDGFLKKNKDAVAALRNMHFINVFIMCFVYKCYGQG